MIFPKRTIGHCYFKSILHFSLYEKMQGVEKSRKNIVKYERIKLELWNKQLFKIK